MKPVLKILIILLPLSIITSVHAQTNAGKVLLGGSSGFALGSGSSKVKSDGYSESGPKTTTVSFTPFIGYFPVNNLSIGLQAELIYSKVKIEDEAESSNTFVMGPFARYYFGTTNIKPFVDATVVFGSIKQKVESGGYSEELILNTTILAGDIGIAFFLNDVVSLDLMVGYSNATSKNKHVKEVKYISSQIDFSFGFSIVL